MLKTLRNHQSIFLRFMLFAVGGVFVFFGVGTVATGEKVQQFATVNGEMITAREYQRTYERLGRAYAQMSRGMSLPPNLLQTQAADQLIHTKLLLQEARRLDLEVSDDEVRNAIAQMGAFQTDGKPDSELYRRVLQQNGFKPAEFEDLQREELLTRKLQSIVASGAVVTEEQLRDRYRFDNEKVALRFVKLKAADQLGQVTMSDDELKKYYEAHSENFREPERFRIRFARFEAAKLGEALQPTDAEIQAHYDENLADYQQLEEVRASHILLKLAPNAGAEEKQRVTQRASEVRAKAQGGADFADLAIQYSEDPGSKVQGGDLGFFSRGKMVPEFEKAAFALEAGAISDLVESPFGIHIIKVVEKKPEGQRQLADVREEVIATLRERRGRELALDKAEAAHKEMTGANGKEFGAVLSAMGVDVEETQPFGRSELISVAKSEADPEAAREMLPRDAELVDTVFATEVGKIGDIVTLDSGYIVFRVEDRKESYVPGFDEARNRVEVELRKEKATAAVKERAQVLLAKLKENPDIDALATAEALHVEETGPASRQGGYLPPIGNAPQLKEAAFRLTLEKKVAPEVYDVTGDSVIAVLKERIAADESKFAEQKDSLKTQARQRAEADAVTQFLNHLKSQAEIRYDDAYAKREG